MTRSALKAVAATASAIRTRASAPAAPTRSQAVVRLGDLDVAPENLRHGEAPDDDIPHLADTIAAAGLLQFPTVRPGRGDEAAYMVLDGRRRLLALRLLRDGGFIDDDRPVEVFVETDRARQAAAVVLTNTAVPVHVADVIAAIGRMLKERLGVKVIARALGHGEIEIRRLAALSKLPDVALEALKTGRITLRQARLIARLKDKAQQAELARVALDGHGLQEWRIQEQLGEGRITARDPRCGLVTPDLYAAAGGRTEVDLFGELPPVLLDPEALTRAWLKRAAAVAAQLEVEGLTVHLSPGDDGPDLPEDLEQLYYAYGGLSDEATILYREARDRAQAAAEVVAAIEPEAPVDDRAEGLEAFVQARIAQDQAGAGQRLATVLVLRPSLRTGVEVECFGPAETESEPAKSADEEADEVEDAPEARGRTAARSAHAPPRAEAPAAEVEGVSHVLHATRTDTATRGLIRALAEAPEAVVRLPDLDPPFRAAIAAAAERHGLDVKLLHALVLTESAYRPDAVSLAGAAGLTQLMPGTARELGVEDRFDPVENLRGGADYLARQLRRFQDVRLALAAYNSGPGRVAAVGRIPRIRETENYVETVIECYLALTAGRDVRSSRACRTQEAGL